MARVKGFQGSDLQAADCLLATPKHFAAYGGVSGGVATGRVELVWLACLLSCCFLGATGSFGSLSTPTGARVGPRAPVFGQEGFDLRSKIIHSLQGNGFSPTMDFAHLRSFGFCSGLPDHGNHLCSLFTPVAPASKQLLVWVLGHGTMSYFPASSLGPPH